MKRPDYIAGVIYDVDDTLLDNQPTGDPLSNLHMRARLDALYQFAAIHGEQYNQLHEVTPQESFDCFALSPVHTVTGAFHTLLKNRGLIDGDISPNDPVLLELVGLKNDAYAVTLAEFGKPVEGAADFVRDLAAEYDIADKNAIASTAILRDIKIFLDSCGLTYLFPDDHIIDVDRVSRPKPDREAFNTAFNRLILPDDLRGNVIALEDDPRGMLSARKSGLFVCALTQRYTREFLEQIEAKPDLIVDSFAELREHFNLQV